MADPFDPEATVVIGVPVPAEPAAPEAVTPPPGAAAAQPPTATGAAEATAARPDDTGPAHTGPGDTPDPDQPAQRPSRGAWREAGDLAGAVPAAEFRAEAAATRKQRSGRRRRPTFWRELPLLVVVALVLTFLIQTFLAKVYVIPSGSMETTLHGCVGCNNDRVVVDKVSYRFSDPQPGDVVVFRGPDSWSSEVVVRAPSNVLVAGLQQLGSLIGIAPPDEKDFVKRVIAVGGQTVRCCDSRDRVMVDGRSLDEPYVYYLPEAGPPRQEPFGPVLVPEGQLWMMGDSRNNSSDSRVPDHGPVPVVNVIGKVQLVVLPIDRFRWIDAVDPPLTAMGLAPDAGAPLALGLLAAVPLPGRRRPDGEVGRFLPDRRRWPRRRWY